MPESRSAKRRSEGRQGDESEFQDRPFRRYSDYSEFRDGPFHKYLPSRWFTPYYENGRQALWVNFLEHSRFHETVWSQRALSGKLLVRLRG